MPQPLATIHIPSAKDASTSLDLELDRDMNLSIEISRTGGFGSTFFALDPPGQSAAPTQIILTPNQATDLIMYLLSNFLNPKK